MILSNITVPLLGLVDTAVIGHLEHAYFLGGSTVGAMFITFVSWLCGFLRMSTTGLAAQAYGQDSDENNQLVLYRGLLVAVLVGLIVIVFQAPYLQASLYLAGGSEQVQFYAKQYAEIRIYGLPAALANMVILGWLLGNQKAKAVMWLLIVTNVINLMLDLLFVLQFNWQVKGVAWATLTAEYSGLVIGLYLVYLAQGPTLIAKAKSVMPRLLNKTALTRYFKLNRDILLRTLSLQACFVFITFQGARLGDDVVAANAILMNFLLLISFGLDGIANAAEAMVGEADGAKNKTKFKQAVLVALVWTIVFAIIYSVAFLLFGDIFVGLISSIDSVVNLASEFLPWIVVLPLLACWCFLLDGIYIGLMRAKTMRNSMLFSTFGVFFPVWFLLQVYGNHGIWAAFSMFMLARGASLAWHFYRHIWLVKVS